MAVYEREWTPKRKDPKTGEYIPTGSKRRTRWRIQFVYHHPNGSVTPIRKHAETNTRKAAEEEERQIRDELQAGTYGKPKPPRTFTALITEHLEDRKPHVKGSTFKNYEFRFAAYLLPTLGSLTLDRVDRLAILKLKAHLSASKPEGAGLSPGGVNGALRLLRAALNFAAAQKYISEAPAVELVVEEAPDEEELFLSQKETKLFLKTARKVDPSWWPYFVVAFRAGLRVSEMIALRVSDVDLEHPEHEQVHVRRRSYDGQIATPKSGRRRSVPCSPSTVAAFRVAIEGKKPEDLVFSYPDGEPFDRHTPRAHIRTIAAACELEPFEVHLCRHTYASHLREHGVSLGKIAELLGQTEESVARRYAHIGRSVLESAARVLP